MEEGGGRKDIAARKVMGVSMLVTEDKDGEGRTRSVGCRTAAASRYLMECQGRPYSRQERWECGSCVEPIMTACSSNVKRTTEEGLQQVHCMIVSRITQWRRGGCARKRMAFVAPVKASYLCTHDQSCTRVPLLWKGFIFAILAVTHLREAAVHLHIHVSCSTASGSTGVLTRQS